MATMAERKDRRTRRSFTENYKAAAVGLVLDESKAVAAAARDLGLTESSIRSWVEQARADRTKGRTGLTTAEREELARLRKEVRELHGARLSKDGLGPLRGRPAIAFAAIATARAVRAPVRMLCRLVGVSPSGFYASQTRLESKRAQEDRRLKVLLHASFTGGRGYYGSPRIHDDLIE